MRHYPAPIVFCRSILCRMATLLALVAAEGVALADDDPPDLSADYQTEVRSDRPATNEAGSITTSSINVSEHRTGIEGAADLLATQPSTQVRQTGLVGAPATVGIRGSSSAQVPVTLDGIPLDSGGFSTVDLGSFDLSLFDRIDIYRGGAPLSAGGGGIGGQVALHTRAVDRSQLELLGATGSFGNRRLSFLASHKEGQNGFLYLVNVRRSDGDYPYLDQGGTLKNVDDDKLATRVNNRFFGATELFKLTHRTAHADWQIHHLLIAQKNGLPGTGQAPALTARADQLRHLLAATVAVTPGPRTTIRVQGAADRHLFHLLDLDDEIGLGRQNQTTTTWSGLANLQGTVRWTKRRQSSLSANWRAQAITITDALYPDQEVYPRHRQLTGGLEHRGSVGRHLRLLGQAQLKWYGSDDGEHEARGLYGVPSVGAEYFFGENLSLVANLGRHVRLPDSGELFGDRGARVGNPALVPESGLNLDAGVRGDGRLPNRWGRWSFESAFFYSKLSDLIVWSQNSRNTMRPENIDEALILGMEVSARLHLWGLLSVAGNYTLTHAVDRSDKPYHLGNQLPGRPVHQGMVRVEGRGFVRGADVKIYTSGNYTGENYLDAANLKAAQLARLEVNAGVEVGLPGNRWVLAFSAKNLLNRIAAGSGTTRRPVADYEDYPLPGRQFLLTVAFKEGG